MYKLMVVDDEYNIRDGIANAIPWADHNIEVAAQAGNAVEAIGKFDQCHPDIVITDIIMDDMTGLDLIEHLYQKNPNIKVVIISGYDDFDFAKRAIRLKVSSYLLKPIVPEELLAIVDNLVRDIEETRRIREKMLSLEDELEQGRAFLLEKFLSDLIYGRITEEKEFAGRSAFLGLRFCYPFYLCLFFTIDNYHDLAAGKSVREIRILVLGIKKVITEIFHKDHMVFVLEENESDLIVILGGNTPGHALTDHLHESTEKIKDTIKDLFGITVTVSMGKAYDNIRDIRKSYLEAGKAIEYRIVAGKDTIIDIEDIQSISGSRYIYPKDREKQILSGICEDDKDKIRSGMDSFFAELLSQSCLKDQIRAAVLQLFMAVSGKLMDMGMNQEKRIVEDNLRFYDMIANSDTVEDIKAFMISEATDSASGIFLRRKGNVKNIIAKSQKYILEHFSDYGISLQTISEHVRLSPAYFSKLYKKETGESYIDYITRVRLEQAKKYLKESDMRISEIGTLVGYPNSQYFSTLFRKYTGISPAEYRVL